MPHNIFELVCTLNLDTTLCLPKKYGITSLNVMQKHIFIFSTHVEEYKPHVKNSNSRNYHTKNDITRKIVISKENKKRIIKFGVHTSEKYQIQVLIHYKVFTLLPRVTIATLLNWVQ